MGSCALLALLAGCTQKPLCPELGACGGTPFGTWILAPGHGSCSEDLYTVPVDTRLAAADQPAARTPPPEEALYDWCDLLVTNGGKMVATHAPQFSMDGSQIGAAWVNFDMARNYAVGLTQTGTYTIDFPALCMREFGAMGDVCGQLQSQLVSTSAHKNIRCGANPEDPAGCLCNYDVSVLSGGSGTYQPVSSNKLLLILTTQLPQRVETADFPQYVTYCSQGTTLQLTGSDGQYLFDEPGLRTLDLVQAPPINCTDGMKGTGEDGIDCGSACPMDCPAPAPPAAP